MRVRVLGELAVEVDGAPADLGGPEPRALLALLVAAEGRPVSVSHLVEQIWGEQPPAGVEASLQSYAAVPTRAEALLAEALALWQGDLIDVRGGATRLWLARPRGAVAADRASWPHRMRADRTGLRWVRSRA